MSSLTQEEFENLYVSLVQKAKGIEVLNPLDVSNYMSLYLDITNNGLALAGVDIGVGAFLDTMTGGIGTGAHILEFLKVRVDAVDMWYSYEICNVRWH